MGFGGEAFKRAGAALEGFKQASAIQEQQYNAAVMRARNAALNPAPARTTQPTGSFDASDAALPVAVLLGGAVLLWAVMR